MCMVGEGLCCACRLQTEGMVLVWYGTYLEGINFGRRPHKSTKKVRVNKGIFHCFRVSLSKLAELKATSARIPQRQNRSKHITTWNSPDGWTVNHFYNTWTTPTMTRRTVRRRGLRSELSIVVSSHGAWTLGSNLSRTNIHKIHTPNASAYLLNPKNISYFVCTTRTLHLSWSHLHSHPFVWLPWLLRQVECLIAISPWRVRNRWTSWRAF